MRSILKFAIIMALLGVTLWAIGFLWFISQVPQQSLESVPTKAKKADLGVVLTGGKGRITHGLLMLYEGRIKQLFITGVNPDVTNDELFANTGSKLGVQIYQRLKKKIFIGREARSTRGNALEIREFMKTHPHNKSVLLITTNYHLPRSIHEVDRVLSRHIEIIPEAIFSPQFPANWWQSSNSTRFLITEYHKTIISYTAALVAQETELGEFLANNPI